MRELKTFHLYHHQPDPLPLEELADRAWLINNAVAYSLVATIQASSPTEALQAAQCKAQGQTLPRAVTVHVGNLFRETLPGDVLVAEYASWKVDPANQLHAIAYVASRADKHCDQRGAVKALAWSPNGEILVASEDDNQVVLHVVASDERYPRAYSRGQYAAERVAWSPNGSRLASAGYYGEVHIWQPAPWHYDGSIGSILICRTEEDRVSTSDGKIHCLTWTGDGLQIAAGRGDGHLARWDARTGACLSLQHRHSKAITALAFAPRCEHLLLTASADTSARIWDCTADREGAVYQHATAVTAAVWSPQEHLVASCERDDPTIHLWNPQTGTLLERIPLSISSTKLLEVCSLAWSPDGRWLAAGCDDSTIQFIDLALHQHVHTYRVNAHTRQRVQALAWSPDGSRLAAGDGSTGINIWQARRDLEAVPNLQPTLTETPPATLKQEA